MKRILLYTLICFVFNPLFAQFQIGQNLGSFQNVAPETQNQALSMWYGVPQMSVSAGSRIDGFSNRPAYQTLSLSAPLGNGTGAALVLNREKAGLSAFLSADFSFLYALNIIPEKATRLVFHGTGSFRQMSINLNDAIVNDLGDPALAGGTSTQPSGNASAGIALMSQNKYYLGINASQLIPVRNGFLNNIWDNQTKIIIGFQGAYIFTLNEYSSLQTWASAGYSYKTFCYQFGADFKFRKTIWAGAGFRDNSTLLFNMGITAQSFSFGYAFSYSGWNDAVTNNATYAGISNSIFLRKIFNEQKSVR